MNGQVDKSKEAYERGLQIFPNSGRLYLELGNIHQDDLNKALQYYEKGVQVDPTHSSNYYWLAKIFCNNTEEEVWGMVYGELFLNLERGSHRTEEISKLLYDTYKSEIKYPEEGKMTVSFSKNMVIPVGEKAKMPFEFAYEMSLMSSAFETEVSLASF